MITNIIETYQELEAEGHRLPCDHILVVEDDMAGGLIIGHILKSAGYEVMIAKSGKEALQSVRDCSPSLILLDCLLPDINGFELCPLLLSASSCKDIPVIFLTLLESGQDKARGFEVGGSDYVVKPPNRQELLARIRTHLELAKARRSLREQADVLSKLVNTQRQRLDQVRTGQSEMLTDPSIYSQIQASVYFMPIHEAGGDFYEITRLGEKSYGMLVADISGHDLGTAYLTGAMKALASSFMNQTLTVIDTMVLFNNSLYRLLDGNQYVTACYVRYDQNTMTLDIANAGHPSPIHQQRKGGLNILDMKGDVLGIFPTVEFQTCRLKVNHGDRLFLYSDGLLEGFVNTDGKTGSRVYGHSRLQKEIQHRGNMPLAEAVHWVEVESKTGQSIRIEDDIVLMGIEF